LARNGKEWCGRSGSGSRAVSCTCVLLRVLYSGGMRQSILLKLFIIIVGVSAVGGAVVLGLARSTEVRGNTVLQRVVPEESTPAPERAVDYLFELDAEDYATYTHPAYGFSFRYPKDFDLLTASWEDEEVVDLYHPTLPLGIRVSTRPFDPHGELFAALASLPDEYDMEAPEGADSTAVGWIDQDTPAPGEHRSAYWFVAHDRIFEITMTAPDLAWLETWMREFVSDAFRLMPPAHDS
jgi:hypothetical protein